MTDEQRAVERNVDARPLPQTREELADFVRAEVRKALDEELQHVLRQMSLRGIYCPPRRETRVAAPPRGGELPAWARYEEGTAH